MLGYIRKFVFATDKQILIFIAVWLMVSAIPALAELPDAIVDTPEELQTVQTQPGSQSADDIAREMANPNAPMAKLTFKNITTFYEGNLPDSDNQVGNLTLFQPVFPFPLSDDGTTNLFVRPAFTFLTGQPSFDPIEGSFDGNTGLGDMGFDVALGKTYPSGWIVVGGVQGTIPIGTKSELTGGQLRLGPELIVCYINETGFLGGFPAHQWDVTGWGDNSYSTSTVEVFAGFFLGGGMNVQSNPMLSYDWKEEQWTIPLNLTVKKIVKIGSLPAQIAASFDYYIEKNDDFGPDWAFTLHFTPIVPNFVHSWLTQ